MLLLQCMSKIKQSNNGKVPQRFRQELVQLHAVDTGRLFAKLGLHFQAGLCLYRASKIASNYGD